MRAAAGLLALVLVLWVAVPGYTVEWDAGWSARSEPGSPYERPPLHHRDGIGKVYMGREIAKVMGHQEAYWLERPSREAEEATTQAIAALDLAPDTVVADIGAGTGYLTFRIAPRVPRGRVYAVDVQPQMRDMLASAATEGGFANVVPVLGTPTDPQLPVARVDVALMVDAYHEFAYPREMMERVVAALKPGGRVVLVEYRRENPLVPIETLHKMSDRQLRREMAAVGLEWVRTEEFLPRQHVATFVKPIATDGASAERP